MVTTRKQAAEKQPQTRGHTSRKTNLRESSSAQPQAGSKDDSNGKQKGFDMNKTADTPLWVYFLLICFIGMTVLSYPQPFQPAGKPTLKHVFFYGWLTAICTGLGVIPFVFLEIVPTYWVGVSNGKV